MLGGIGFTWEHDAHLYLRRAIDAAAARSARRRLARSAPRRCARRRAPAARGRPARGAEARPRRRPRVPRRARRRSTTWRSGDRARRRRATSRRSGRRRGAATPALEQLVIDEEFRAGQGAAAPDSWSARGRCRPLIVHGTAGAAGALDPADAARRDRWCQLFSEPGAGSDLAALDHARRRASTAAGSLNGQKVWTSMAKEADWGICLARTDPERAQARGHLVLHRRHADARHRHPAAARAHRPRDVQRGVLRRRVRARRLPRRRGARRLALPPARRSRTSACTWASGSTIGGGVRGVLGMIRRRRASTEDDRLALAEAGELVATGHALLAVLGYRLTLSALGGRRPAGSEAAVRKLLGVRARPAGAGGGPRARSARPAPSPTVPRRRGRSSSSSPATSRSPAARARSSATSSASAVLGLPKDP